jgi:hypothetical protein
VEVTVESVVERLLEIVGPELRGLFDQPVKDGA